MQKPKDMTKILFHHFLWCKKEGRNVRWYGSFRSRSRNKKHN